MEAIDKSNNSSGYTDVKSVYGNTNVFWKKANTSEDYDITNYRLRSNFPNPFNPSTKIEFQIPEQSFVNLTVYNAIGEKVASLVERTLTKGKYTATFEGHNLPSGIYIYKLTAGKYTDVKKMILAK